MASRRTSAWEVMSAANASTSGFLEAARISAAACSARARSRPVMPTRAPSEASPIAVALPIPPVPPVIRTTLSAMGSAIFCTSFITLASPCLQRSSERTGPSRPSLDGPVEGSDGDDDRTSRMSCSDMPDRLGGLTQWVRPVDDRRDLPGFNEPLQDEQVCPVLEFDARAQLLAHEP